MVNTITDQEFHDKVKNHKRLVIKYHADWCGTCRLISPKYKKLSESEPFIDIEFIEVDAEKNPEARKWANVKNLPFFAVVKDGEIVMAESTGKEEKLVEMLQKIAL